jgi:hypothetical protein
VLLVFLTCVFPYLNTHPLSARYAKTALLSKAPSANALQTEIFFVFFNNFN